MGCNYYGKRRFTEGMKNKVRELIDKNDFDAVRKILPREIHLGKSSFGWVFIFNHHNFEYFKNYEKSFKKFIDSCDIKDEYGKIVSNEEFWDLVEEKRGGCNIGLDYKCKHWFSPSTYFS